MTETHTASEIAKAIYTVRVGSGRECYICLPDNDGYVTLDCASEFVANLLDHVSGEAIR